MREHRVRGDGGIGLHVVEAGDPEAQPILFIHGYMQSTYAWREQFAGNLARDFRLVAFDLRGHGNSDKPADERAYQEAQGWAGDIAAILDALALERPVVVAWSYAGLVVCDYLRLYGEDRLGAIDFVGAATIKGGEKARSFAGPELAVLMPAVIADEDTVAARALERFAVICTAAPYRDDVRAAIVEISANVPVLVRGAMQRGRRIDNDDVLATLRIPVLVTHGEVDAVVRVASGEHTARVTPGARLSIYPGIGHSPFAEDPARFERELRELAALAQRPAAS